MSDMNTSGFLYHFVCFDCLVSFKRPASKGAPSDSAHRIDSEIEHICPNCGNKLHFMGRQFRPPKKSANNSWYVIKELWNAGFRFIGNGSHTGARLPEKKSEVEVFIENNPNHPLKVSE